MSNLNVQSSPTGAASPPAGSAPTTVFAHAGDRLGDVARRYGVSEQALRNANPGLPNPDHLLAQQRLQLPTGDEASPVPTLQKPPGRCTEDLDAARQAWSDKGVLGRMASPQTGWGESYEINDARIFRRECEALPATVPQEELTKRQQALQDHFNGVRPLPPEQSLKLRKEVQILEKSYGKAQAQPPLSPAEKSFQETRDLRFQNDLAMGVIGPFAALPGLATRALGGTEQQVSGAVNAGVQVMEVAGAHLSAKGQKAAVEAATTPVRPATIVQVAPAVPKPTAVVPRSPEPPAPPGRPSALPPPPAAPATATAIAATGAAAAHPPTTVITPEMERKILWGQQKINKLGNPSNDIIGAHGGGITNKHPDFAVQTLRVNADGSRDVKLVKQLPNGNASRMKTRSLFPEHWTDAQSIQAVRTTAETPAIATRPDGRSLHQATIDGVKVEVIKNGPTVEAGYATGSVGFQSAKKFLTGSN